ncbi:MAG: hypothetical protein RL885_00600 [Planctomycetota bacterium]
MRHGLWIAIAALVGCQAVEGDGPGEGGTDVVPSRRRAVEVAYDTFERDVRLSDLPTSGGSRNRTRELTFNRAILRGHVSPFEDLTFSLGLTFEDIDDDTFVEEPSLDGQGVTLGVEWDPRLVGRLRADLGLSAGWYRSDEISWRGLEVSYAELYTRAGIGLDLIDSARGGLDGPGRVTARGGLYFDGIEGRYRADVPFPVDRRGDLTTGGPGVYLGMDVWSAPLFLRAVAWFGEREGIGLVAGLTF